MYQFRDPVHGFIDVSEDELKIINSAPFQRLRNIHQLLRFFIDWSALIDASYDLRSLTKNIRIEAA